MGVIKYAVTLRKNPVKGTTKAYAIVSSTDYTFNDLAIQAAAETTVTRTDCEAVVRAVLDIAKREILKGNSIELGSMGKIYPTLQAKGMDKVEDVTGATITGVRLRFRPTVEFKQEMTKAKYEKTILKKTATKALADETAAMAAKLAALAETGGEGEGGGNG